MRGKEGQEDYMFQVFESLILDLVDEMKKKVSAAHERDLLIGEIVDMRVEGIQELHFNVTVD